MIILTLIAKKKKSKRLHLNGFKVRIFDNNQDHYLEKFKINVGLKNEKKNCSW